MNPEDSVELDEIDIHILEILQENCNIKLTHIAKDLSIAESTIRYRIDRMEKKGVITNYIALLNPRKVGLNITAIMMIKITPQHINRISDELAKFKELRHLFRSTGVYDMISVVNARNIHHLNELMERIKMMEGVNDLMVEVATELIKVDPKFSLR
jgi:Lrp/AsnC family transcriptional regulator for asnA, asnC and gidA